MKLPNYEIRGLHESTSPTDNKAIQPTSSGRQKPYPLERSNTRFIEEAIDQMQKEIDETAGESSIPTIPTGGQIATDVPTNSGPGIGTIQALPRRAGKPRPLPALEDD
ncbi:hypothetical protein WR25_00585 [Diploscapter pachys]|uniref:Uncharacterized protein n=1 Tax=Diploscapter pachys TaxID=2018661 RepID=A0A2A2JJW8_9BILA|nr:hypothetical protein WR25_00585 [Diploscapter pachys]